MANKRKSPVLALLLVLSFVISGCDFIFWERYSNNDYRFSILLPRAWDKKAGEQKNVVLVALAPLESKQATFASNVTITVVDLPSEIPLEVYYDTNKAEILQIIPQAYDILEGQVQTGFLRGQWLAFSFRMEDRVLRMITCLWIRKNRVYVVTCSSQADKFVSSQSIFYKLLNSMRISY